jgi:hypothetical protein
MENNLLLNQLKLAYSPLSNYDFSVIKHDIDVQKALENSSLYVICQRPILSFENLKQNQSTGELEFEIVQKNNAKKIKIKLPLFQENLAGENQNKLLINFGTFDPNYTIDPENIQNIHGFKIYNEEIKKENFIAWFSPEKFLHNYFNGYIIAEIEGDIRDVLNYQVHYVGKATDQKIWERLTGHSTLQDILSLEYPFNYGSLPTHEIAILLFEFRDNLSIQSFGTNSSIDNMIDSLTGKNYPEQRTVFLEAEKALIKAMKPKHNKILFKNFPNQQNPLSDFKTCIYTFVDPITLKYASGEIRGGLSYFGGDQIVITENKDFKIVKQ